MSQENQCSEYPTRSDTNQAVQPLKKHFHVSCWGALNIFLPIHQSIQFSCLFCLTQQYIAEFANTVDPDEFYEPSHLDLQCFPSSL